MSLSIGDSLGPYEVVAPLGEGGMGQVYRARDTRLDRDVALKILPEAFAHDADRLARFTREAKTLASLNHSHIAGIYGLDRQDGRDGQDGTTFIVMELVEGEDLSQRISRGAIPVDETLLLARQIAEALEAAHEQGIIHRDLKPANIKLRADGTIKVLDFGLAKAMDSGAGGPGQSGNAGSASMSPTLTTPAMTLAGVILGTAAYMAPEQARGKLVDRRADIWAFGVVLFEMLAGRRPFAGEDISMTLAFVMTKEPDWASLPAGTPPALRTLLRRCLEKDPKRRLQAIGDARVQIEDVISGAAPVDAAQPPASPERATSVLRHSSRSPAVAWTIAGAAVVLAGALLVLWQPRRSAPVPSLRKLLVSIGADAAIATDLGAAAILSPDGTTLAFAAQQSGQPRLFVRRLDQLQATPLAGTEGAGNPFFSPDGQWIGFFAGGKVKKVSVVGGAAITLCDSGNARGGTWTDDDAIIFTPGSGSNVTLARIAASGGTPTVFGTRSKGASTQRWPQALPAGKGVLFTENSTTNNFDAANLVVEPLSGGTPKVVVRGGYYGRYVPSGHLVYMQQGTLFAVRFDRDRLETFGQAMPVLDGITANPGVTGGAQLAVSSEGTLVYVPGTARTTESPIHWMTGDGKTSPLRATKAVWANPRFSPDGQKLAMEIFDGKQSDVWVYDWKRDTLTQLTFDPGQDRWPSWTPDGRRIVFSSDRAKPGIGNLYWVNADGTGDVVQLTDDGENYQFSSSHPSGKYLVFNAVHAGTGLDLMILPMEGDAARGWKPGKPYPFLNTPAIEVFPMFSPDGRWIAYFSNEAATESNGNVDVYVRPFPGPGGKWRISTDGGWYPKWSASSRELLFSTPAGQVMTAPYTVVGDSFQADKPRPWSPTLIQGNRVAFTTYDLHPDGKRLAVMLGQDQVNASQDKVVFVFNFGDYLRTIAPTTR